MSVNLAVYVPKSPPIASVFDPRSAIVGTPASEWFPARTTEPDSYDAKPALSDDDSWRIVVDYEGRRYGQTNMVTFADKAVHAADRHTTHYPTAARACVRAEDLIEVGVFDGSRVTPNNDGAAALLRAWIGSDDPKELEVTR